MRKDADVTVLHVERGILLFLHDAAHSVDGTVTKVSPQHLPHQLQTESSHGSFTFLPKY